MFMCIFMHMYIVYMCIVYGGNHKIESHHLEGQPLAPCHRCDEDLQIV